MTTGAISRAKLQSDRHHQQTNIQFFLQAGCPSCRPTNSVKALKVKISHSTDLFTPSSPGGLPTLSLTTNSSWLPWGRVAMPHYQPSDASTQGLFTICKSKINFLPLIPIYLLPESNDYMSLAPSCSQKSKLCFSNFNFLPDPSFKHIIYHISQPD